MNIPASKSGRDRPDIRSQIRGWNTLKSLHAKPLELGTIRMLRSAGIATLTDPIRLADLITRLGLNGEARDEWPVEVHGFLDTGLRIWQYPIQFAPFLLLLSTLQVRSYLELGVRHGGSFVLTTEYLDRFSRLDYSIGIDVLPCPGIADFARINDRARFVQTNSLGPEFRSLVEEISPIDLVFIDSHHEEAQCLEEFARLDPHANMIALHDISNLGCPGIGRAWAQIKACDRRVCFEFTAQYPGLGPLMGIGLAIKPDRLTDSR